MGEGAARRMVLVTDCGVGQRPPTMPPARATAPREAAGGTHLASSASVVVGMLPTYSRLARRTMSLEAAPTVALAIAV
jgi:hypothetical protein